MRCNHCQNYGHTAARCRSQEMICRRCSSVGHKAEDCDMDQPAKCVHCQDEHEAGSRDCPRHKREMTLLDIQSKYRVSMKRAVQIEKDENILTVNKQKEFLDVLDISMSASDKRAFTPWLLEKSLTAVAGKVLNVRSVSDETYSVQVTSKEQSQQLLSLKLLNNKPVTVTRSNRFEGPKGLAYIYEYNLAHFEIYKAKLIETLPIKDIAIATWIKSRNPRAIPLLISFNQPEIPIFLNIPGEQALTKIYEYKNRPMLCKQCLQFGHTTKRCRNLPKCTKCTSDDHNLDSCTSEQPTCHHSKENHYTGSSKCKETQQEQEILSIQSKYRIPRSQARFIFHKNNPNFKTMSYSEATIRTNNSATSNRSNTHPNPKKACR